jgi:hypothetical protein
MPVCWHAPREEGSPLRYTPVGEGALNCREHGGKFAQGTCILAAW